MFTSRAARSVECVFGIAISFAARIRYTGMCARCQHKSFGPQSALSLSLQRPARLVPGVDSADHVTDVAEAQFLRGPHRQRRALTTGAVKDQLPPRRGRSEERRGGKECVSKCKSRWSRYK